MWLASNCSKFRGKMQLSLRRNRAGYSRMRQPAYMRHRAKRKKLLPVLSLVNFHLEQLYAAITDSL